MNNQSKDQKSFGQNGNKEKVQSDQSRRDGNFNRDQKSTGAQRNISPDSKRVSPTDTDLAE